MIVREEETIYFESNIRLFEAVKEHYAYSPNLNLIERLWKFMRKKVINTTYYSEFKAFREAIHNFFNSIDQYKNELKQFIGSKLHVLNPVLTPKTTLG